MGQLKAFDGTTWQTVPTVGPPGPTGPAGPVGPVGSGGALVVMSELVGIATSHATANTMGNLVTGSVAIDPTKMYHIFASVRAIADPGALIGFAQFRVTVGIQLEGYDCVSGPDSGLWGSWSQTWLKEGSDLSATAATVAASLDLQLNAAAKQVYAPRLYVIQY